jgi:hypothetical protein
MEAGGRFDQRGKAEIGEVTEEFWILDFGFSIAEESA